MRAAPSPLRRLQREPLARRALLLGTLLSAVQGGLTVAAWILVARAVDRLAFGGPAAEPLAPLLLRVAGLLLARAVISALREGLGSTLAAATVDRLREQLTAVLTRLGPGSLTGERGAELATTALTGLDRLQPYLARVLTGSAHAGVYALGGVATLLLLDPLSALVVAITVPLAVVFLWLVGLAAAGLAERQWAQLTRLGERLSGALRALPTLRAYGAEQGHARQLTLEAERYQQATLGVLRLAFLNGFVLDLAATLSVALVAVTVGIRLFEAKLGFPVALAVLMITPEIFGPLRQLGTDRHATLEAEPAAGRLYALLGTAPRVTGDRSVPARPHLRLHHLQVHLAGRELLQDLSLDLPPGTHLALTGESGAGKTTLLHTLLGYLPFGGELLLNGHPLPEYDLDRWRQAAPLVTQRPRFLHGTVRDNLRRVAPDAPDPELLRLLALVDLTTPLDRQIAEDGHPLSGGERHRLALARALLSPAPVLLLDEPLAQLDPLSERALLARLTPHLKGRTVLLVTHRDVPAGFQQAVLRAGQLELPQELTR
ncbi:thiol reductant ABC exporter subunit CydD [Deinococcus sonorensis]|uniref:Thiol reductant ABC exporter subunit CydD n=2 Tax=Deinococcus sonorensis TaxID=309891 RepID=A0AAU7U8Y0_9DEIO